MRYRLYFPAPDEHGRTMLDYFGLASVLDEARTRPYEAVYEGEIAVTYPAVLDALWQRHNVGDAEDHDRPRAREIRSMCIGDILVTEAGTFIAERFGFVLVGDDAPVGIAGLGVARDP